MYYKSKRKSLKGKGCQIDYPAQNIQFFCTGARCELKQYHTEYRRSLNEEAQEKPNTVKSILPPEQPEEIKEISERVNKPNQKQSAIDKLFASK